MTEKPKGDPSQAEQDVSSARGASSFEELEQIAQRLVKEGRMPLREQFLAVVDWLNARTSKPSKP